jgi:hypothetical protein
MNRRAKRSFTQEEITELRSIYAEAEASGRRVDLRDFCQRSGRHRPHVCRKARQLGLNTRPQWGSGQTWEAMERRLLKEAKAAAARKNATEEARRRRLDERKAKADWLASPIGSLIAKQRRTAVACKASAKAKSKWQSLSEREQREISSKRKRTMIARYGKGSPNRVHQNYTRGVGGIRADLGIYLRSTWEANWARYLNLGITKGIIASWQYEPRVFTFPDDADAEVRSYTPDFLVRMADGTEVYHEVKGWLTARYRRAIELMRTVYPKVRLQVFTRREYQELTRRWRDSIPEWEHCPAATRRKLARERAASRTRQCKQCGKDFAVSSRRKFCSEVCSKRAQCVAHCEKQRARTTKQRPTTGRCEWCGVDFQIGRMGRVRRFCSRPCWLASSAKHASS